MASINHLAAASRERTSRSIVDFAIQLETEITATRSGSAIDVLVADLSQHIQAMENISQQNTKVPSAAMARDLERRGRTIWNLCIRVKRDQSNDTAPADRTRLLVSTRVFAFYMLDIGRHARGLSRDAETNVVYLLNLALTLGRICLGDAEIEWGKLALRKAADYLERLKTLESPKAVTQTGDLLSRLEADYLTMRMALSWKEDRLDVAEHMFTKTDALRQSLHVSSAEAMADTLRHIGFDLAARGNHTLALKWLKRAHGLIEIQNLEQLSTHGLELRLAICHGIFQSLLAQNTSHSLQEAGDLVTYVETELGDRPVVLHWRLELLQKTPDEVADAHAYASVLRRLIRAFDHSDETFHFILHQIQQMREKNIRLAIGLLEEFTKLLASRSGNVAWLSKAIVKRIWMATVQDDEEDPIPALQGLIDGTFDSLSGPLQPDAAGSVQSLIWKKVEALLGAHRFAAADAWCQLAIHQLFASGGDGNAGKFGRKRIWCALKLNDADRAKDAYHNMPKAPQEDVLTSYLMFKVSLLGWDHDLGCESIARLSKASDTIQKQDILYACVREAQQSGDRICTIEALKAVANSWAVGGISSESLPAILRCTIRLMNVSEEERSSDGPESSCDWSEDICDIFDKAAEHAKQSPKDEQGRKVFTVSELSWFRKSAYNLGAMNCHVWPLHPILRIFTACLAFINCYPKDLPLADEADLRLMGLRCHFVIAAVLVSLARAEDRLDERLQRYLEARKQVAAYDSLMQDGLGVRDDAVQEDIGRKLATLFVFDFEGAVWLKAWDDLNVIVRKAKPCKDEALYKAMGDCLLRSQAPGKVMYATMKLIINEIFELEDFDGAKLAKYMRCLVQATLPLDDCLALQLLDQAQQIAREGRQVGRPFPGTELEWLVATAFNHAVDLYVRVDEARCHVWALKAMALAEYSDDGGSLAATLRERFARLRFDGTPQG
ncbi:hypothetical protein HIM_08641 [Hirsutella minnesotensis 3608]|uniref:Protein ZIP4 homolog n=1 Tax=Hirsutella minnesotensis 3608 TaxID=1043627 RepID=A0A0F7ZH37_9HYPO|nr:hypothetical protein HIM_08641 [Hirsutella minnesotensis 3608]